MLLPDITKYDSEKLYYRQILRNIKPYVDSIERLFRAYKEIVQSTVLDDSQINYEEKFVNFLNLISGELKFGDNYELFSELANDSLTNFDEDLD